MFWEMNEYRRQRANAKKLLKIHKIMAEKPKILLK